MKFLTLILMCIVLINANGQSPKGIIRSVDTAISKPIYPKKVITTQHWSSYSPYYNSNKHITQNDSNGFTKPRIIYHDLGISKEDSTRLAAESLKQDIEYYLHLKYKTMFSPIYIDSLFRNGFKIDWLDYFNLKTELAKEIEKNRAK